MSYRHTQHGSYVVPLFLVLAAALLVVVAFSSAALSSLLVVTVTVVIIRVVLVAFSRLTVSVEGEEMTVAFRWGWPVRRIDLGEVHRVDQVRNKWWYGFGVRLTPDGWMYNVWGLDAVLLNFRDGKTFLIGTDDPEALLAAVNETVGWAPEVDPGP